MVCFFSRSVYNSKEAIFNIANYSLLNIVTSPPRLVGFIKTLPDKMFPMLSFCAAQSPSLCARKGLSIRLPINGGHL